MLAAPEGSVRELATRRAAEKDEQRLQALPVLYNSRPGQIRIGPLGPYGQQGTAEGPMKVINSNIGAHSYAWTTKQERRMSEQTTQI